MTPAFVAEARRVLIPAVRWMRAEGWNFGNMLSPDGMTTIHYDEVTDSTGHTHPKVIVHSHMTGLDETCHPTSMQQAVDFLVTAGVLPESMHSLHAGYVQAVDSDGEEVWFDPDLGGVVWVAAGYEGKATRVLVPLFRRVAAEVDVESTDLITAMTR